MLTRIATFCFLTRDAAIQFRGAFMVDLPAPPRHVSIESLKRLMSLSVDRPARHALIHEHFHVRIGNSRPTVDRDDGLDQIDRLLGQIDGFDAEFCEAWVRGGSVVVETEIRFHDAAGYPQVIPCMIVARTLGGLVADLRIYLDPTPLFRPIRIF
jgi:hypothetical protein